MITWEVAVNARPGVKQTNHCIFFILFSCVASETLRLEKKIIWISWLVTNWQQQGWSNEEAAGMSSVCELLPQVTKTPALTTETLRARLVSRMFLGFPIGVADGFWLYVSIYSISKLFICLIWFLPYFSIWFFHILTESIPYCWIVVFISDRGYQPLSLNPWLPSHHQLEHLHRVTDVAWWAELLAWVTATCEKVSKDRVWSHSVSDVIEALPDVA